MFAIILYVEKNSNQLRIEEAGKLQQDTDDKWYTEKYKYCPHVPGAGWYKCIGKEKELEDGLPYINNYHEYLFLVYDTEKEAKLSECAIDIGIVTMKNFLRFRQYSVCEN